ncbi:MAG TPA: 2-oxoacid:acceptor oxidoreductase subunit alpha [Dehalococcoidia bacterium]|nr:2-oxoacid:acceptor oxidoreductase subunit alpha [Dehalococcoidia bacterium]
MRHRLTIGIAGAGGDGVVLLGSLLQRLAASQGYFGQMPRYYGPQIRGGASGVKLSLDTTRASVPGDTADIIVCFNWEKYAELEQELPLGINSIVFYDNAPAKEGISLPEKSFQVGFSEISKELNGATTAKNIVALGLLERILALPEGLSKGATVQDDASALLERNGLALKAGRRLLLEFPFAELRLSPPRDASAKAVLHGNAAVVQGAIRAGCRTFFGYPITPASEIMEEMQERFSQGNGVFLQAEDEIAAVGFALGASLTGAKSMTATTGPGIDLMTEMIGLASSAEIPVVIVDVQRCGPATGIPSKSEQSDLNHAIYGGHGDASRVVIGAYDMEGCYRLLIESFNISEYYQTPVILLSDQWLGQTTVATSSDFLKRDYAIAQRKRPGEEYRNRYRRYEFTEDYISPMAFAGDEGLTYQVTGLAHNEKGRPSFDFATHQRMHEKRWEKLTPLRDRDELVRVFGREESRKGIVAFGSSAQFILETLEELQLNDEVKVCIPELIHPLPNRLATFVGSLDKLLVVEMSYSAQFYHYLRSQMNLPSDTEIYARAGGRAFSRKELSVPITELAR